MIEFAELDEFVDLKLKNYSSGMLVRLAFSLMLEVNADILLIDEVLAVGDAAFQQKCADAFREMKAAGKTIVLVTHEMSTVEEYCHRAMLIGDGRIQHIGDPGEVGRHYLRLNFEREGGEAGHTAGEGGEVRLLDTWIEDDDGERITNIEQGGQIRLRAELEIDRDAPGGLGVGFVIVNADGVGVFEFGTLAVDDVDDPTTLSAGQRVKVVAEVENLLSPGRYFVHAGEGQAHQPQQRPRGGGLPRRHLVPAGRAGHRPQPHRHLGDLERRHRHPPLIALDGARQGLGDPGDGHGARPGAAVALAPPALADAIQRVRTGQGGESDAGFSFQTKIDTWGNSRNRDLAGPAQFDRVRPTTAVLWLPAENDQLVGPPTRGAIPAAAFLKAHGVPAQVIVFPALTHFQAYSGAAFEVGSNLAADWFLKQLGVGRKP